MKVNSSEYLRKVKPVLVKLRDRLLQEYPYASILAQDSVTKNYSVSKTSSGISMSERIIAGFPEREICHGTRSGRH